MGDIFGEVGDIFGEVGEHIYCTVDLPFLVKLEIHPLTILVLRMAYLRSFFWKYMRDQFLVFRFICHTQPCLFYICDV